MVVAGVVGAYAVEVRASARWAINRHYNDVLPVDVEPVSESVSPFRWSVVYDFGPDRYTVSCDEFKTTKTDERDVDVHRARIPTD